MAATILPFFNLQSANYTLLTSDDVVQFNCASASLTATLPSATLVPVGKRFEVRRSADNIPANILTINTTSSQTIDGRASGSIRLSPSDYMVVISDGSNWQVVTLQETVAAEYNIGAATLTLANATNYFTDFGTKETDTHSAVVNAGVGLQTSTATAWKFVAPVAGRYMITSSCLFPQGNTTSITTETAIYINSVQKMYSLTGGQSSGVIGGGVQATVSGTIRLNAGDAIQVLLYNYNSATGNQTLVGSGPGNRISIIKVGN